MDVETIASLLDQDPQRIAEMIALLRINQNNVITVQNDRAWMQYGPFRMTFLREGDLWKIETPD